MMENRAFAKFYRDIVFRAKEDFNDGDWKYGDLVFMKGCTGNKIAQVKQYTRSGFWLSYTVDASTIGQYTGVNDRTSWEELATKERDDFLRRLNYKKSRKNKKEDWCGKWIFEGDILEFTNTATNCTWLAVVEFSVGKFVCRKVTHSSGTGEFNDFSFWSDRVKYKVVGNVYDNKGLLEREDN